jgi:2-(1,2-epoxy-1,2-dihydrophenyl)acetyl-CoA isomerase
MGLRIDVADGVGTVVLDRPDARNALTLEMRDGLVEAVARFRRDPAVRAVLVTGEGTAFCAGMDLSASTVAKAGQPDFETRDTVEALRIGVHQLIRELWLLDKPTVAAVNGAAVGPGAHIALACDFVLVHERTRFLWTFARNALVVDAGGAYLLPRLVGLPRAKAMVLLGEGATGEEAVTLGLAYKCVPADTLLDEARALAVQLAAGPTKVLGMSKRLLNQSFETDIHRSLAEEGLLQALATTTDDLKEGMHAFREKRDPGYTGR